jgi:hypothetical protein
MSKLFLYALFVFSPIAVFAQSTFGTVLGTVTHGAGRREGQLGRHSSEGQGVAHRYG